MKQAKRVAKLKARQAEWERMAADKQVGTRKPGSTKK